VNHVGWCASFTDASRSTSCQDAYRSRSSALYRKDPEAYCVGATNGGTSSLSAVYPCATSLAGGAMPLPIFNGFSISRFRMTSKGSP
jgi:hypothetical protein